jgi:hypothetical protein
VRAMLEYNIRASYLGHVRPCKLRIITIILCARWEMCGRRWWARLPGRAVRLKTLTVNNVDVGSLGTPTPCRVSLFEFVTEMMFVSHWSATHLSTVLVHAQQCDETECSLCSIVLKLHHLICVMSDKLYERRGLI